MCRRFRLVGIFILRYFERKRFSTPYHLVSVAFYIFFYGLGILLGYIDLWCLFSASGNLFLRETFLFFYYTLTALIRAIDLLIHRVSLWISVLNLVTHVSQCWIVNLCSTELNCMAVEVKVRFENRVLGYIKSNQNLSLYSQYCAKACNELVAPISASLHSSNTAHFCSGVVSLETLFLILLDRDLNLKPPAPQTSAFLLDQLYGVLDTEIAALAELSEDNWRCLIG